MLASRNGNSTTISTSMTDFDVWNKIDGMEVLQCSHRTRSRPPVSISVPWDQKVTKLTAIWRTLPPSTFSVVVTEDETAPGISEARLTRTKSEYHVPTNVKKIDIGGGLIHGAALDFKDDPQRRSFWRIPSASIRRKRRRSAPAHLRYRRRADPRLSELRLAFRLRVSPNLFRQCQP